MNENLIKLKADIQARFDKLRPIKFANQHEYDVICGQLDVIETVEALLKDDIDSANKNEMGIEFEKQEEIVMNVQTVDNPNPDAKRYKIKTYADMIRIMREIGEDKHERFVIEMAKSLVLAYRFCNLITEQDLADFSMTWIDD